MHNDRIEYAYPILIFAVGEYVIEAWNGQRLRICKGHNFQKQVKKTYRCGPSYKYEGQNYYGPTEEMSEVVSYRDAPQLKNIYDG